MAIQPEVSAVSYLDMLEGACQSDCGIRSVKGLPPPLPDVGHDFDWDLRDYDGFRIFMLEELAARFPDRTRWAPADIEVVIVEVLAAALDQLSDQLDRVSQEAYLETAKNPASVRRLLNFIGTDVTAINKRLHLVPFDSLIDSENYNAVTDDDHRMQEQYWYDHPHAMEEARKTGPENIHRQRRMVTTEDYTRMLQLHPLVERAHALESWSGSWPVIDVAVILTEGVESLDDPIFDIVGGDRTPENRRLISLMNAIKRFHLENDLPVPDQENWKHFSARPLLRYFIDAYRMVGFEVELKEAKEIPLQLGISLMLDPDYYQSEVRAAADIVLSSTRPEGFFFPGRLGFGEDIYLSDLFEVLLAIEGVDNVCINNFKRLGQRFPNRTSEASISLSGREVAVCDNDPGHPERGSYSIRINSGKRG